MTWVPAPRNADVATVDRKHRFLDRMQLNHGCLAHAGLVVALFIVMILAGTALRWGGRQLVTFIFSR